MQRLCLMLIDMFMFVQYERRTIMTRNSRRGCRAAGVGMFLLTAALVYGSAHAGKAVES